jgi:hypothetical protein
VRLESGSDGAARPCSLVQKAERPIEAGRRAASFIALCVVAVALLGAVV